MFGDIETWRTITLGAAAFGQTVFVLLYLTFPWWRTFLGRALFYKAAILCILLDLIYLSRLFGFGANDRLFVTLYGLLAVGIWVQTFAFLRVKPRAGDNADHRSQERRWDDLKSGDKDGGGGV